MSYHVGLNSWVVSNFATPTYIYIYIYRERERERERGEGGLNVNNLFGLKGEGGRRRRGKDHLQF